MLFWGYDAEPGGSKRQALRFARVSLVFALEARSSGTCTIPSEPSFGTTGSVTCGAEHLGPRARVVSAEVTRVESSQPRIFASRLELQFG